jgi:hypothetical protein
MVKEGRRRVLEISKESEFVRESDGIRGQVRSAACLLDTMAPVTSISSEFLSPDNCFRDRCVGRNLKVDTL